MGMQFRRRDLRRLPFAEMDYVASSLGGLLVGVVNAGVVAINRGWDATEAVLERERHAAIGMILELGQADEHVGILIRLVHHVLGVHVGILIRLVHHVLGVHVGRAGEFEARVLFALA